MKNKTKHLLTAGILVIFALFAISSRVNKIHYGAFNYHNRVEDKSPNSLEKNDGSKVYGSKVVWKSGILSNHSIRIDDQKFKISEIRGYLDGEIYYGRQGGEYIQRIIHGPKVNVYVKFTQVTQTTTDHGGFSHTSSYTRTDHYAQLGDNAELLAFGSQKDIKRIVESCPLSVEMIDKSSHQIRKAIRADGDYLNRVFEIYNNGCKPLGDNDSTAIRLQ